MRWRALRVMILALVLVPMVMAAYWWRDSTYPLWLAQLASGCVAVTEGLYFVTRQVVGWQPVSLSWLGLPHVSLDYWLTVYLYGLLVALPSELLGGLMANWFGAAPAKSRR